MAIRTVLWNTNKPLSCAPCPEDTADVILCVPAEKVNYFECPIQPVEPPEVTAVGTYPMSTINGEVVNHTKFSACSYRYTIEFDDAQLQPNQVILDSDITDVICRGCFITYVDQQAGNEVRLEEIDSEGITFLRLTSQHGCQFEFGHSQQLLSQVTVRTNTGPGSEYYDVTSLLLTPGTWELSGAIDYFAANTAALTLPRTARAGVSTTTGNSAAGLVLTLNLANNPIPDLADTVTVLVPTHQVTVTVNTTYYLKGFIGYGSGQPQHLGTLRAKRIH